MNIGRKGINREINHSQPIIRGVYDPYFIVDKDLNIQYINDQALTLLGYSRSDIEGKKINCGSVCKTPVCGTAKCTLVNAMKTKEPVVAKTKAAHKNGKKIPVRATCSPIMDNSGKVIGGCEIITDLTKEENEMAKQKSLMTGIPDPVFTTNKDLIINDCNEAFLKAMGYSRKEVVGKMSCGELCRTPVCNTSDCTIKKCMKTKEPIVADTTAIKRDGTKIDIRACCNALFDKDGKAVGGFELIQDITDRKAMSRDLAAMAENFSSSSQELAASAEEVNASMEEITSTIQEVAQGAQVLSQAGQDAMKASNETDSSAKQGQQVATQVKERMDEIKTVIEEATGIIKGLESKSKEINRIVETINSISEQTNLLALNAAIEAARAGDAGRGFAVVADEVRALAEDSRKETDQIRDMIKEIQKEIDLAASSMGKSTEYVINGSSAVDDAMKAFNEIPVLVASVDEGLKQVNSVTEQNAASSEEVSASVEEVTSSLDQVTASANEMATNTERLSTLAQKVMDM